MTIRLGVNPIGWSNDDLPEIGGDIPLETCLAEAKEAGFEGMEKGNKLPNDGAALKAFVAELPLPAADRERLARLTPADYIGLARELARAAGRFRLR